ncbi:MAG TPA: L,D-transpeptidase/peptidoglycan binding protein [Solirubrobacterales bacterium]|nr:L,D-transpeptidase/peptidoglycan binding protein [Solirubrobacterales bacterium]
MAAYAIDRVNSDKIADGIQIGGIDVGGMSAGQARNRVHARLVKPLDKPVTATYNGTKYVLNPDKLQIRADIDGMIDAALRASQSGGFPTRVWRYTTGGSVDREIAPHITYSSKAIDEFVDNVASDVNTPAQDATISPTPSSLNTVPGSDGVSLLTDRLRTQLRGAIESPHNRTVKAPVQKLEPDVTTDELAQEYPVYITIDRAAFQLRLWRDLELAKTYTIAVGAAGYETSTGVYNVESKQVNPTWYVPDAAWAGDLAGEVVPPGPDNPLQARWMGFFDGAGIHGTSDVGSLGSAASHGCIRMSVPDVIELYDQVPLGTPIYIGN